MLEKSLSEKKHIEIKEKVESKVKKHEDYLAGELAKIEENNAKWREDTNRMLETMKIKEEERAEQTLA